MGTAVVHFFKPCGTCGLRLQVIKKLSGTWWYECSKGCQQLKSAWMDFYRGGPRPSLDPEVRAVLEADRRGATAIVIRREHRWKMSWPGNCCLDCGCDDPIEADPDLGLVNCGCGPPGCEECCFTGCIPSPNLPQAPPCRLQVLL